MNDFNIGLLVMVIELVMSFLAYSVWCWYVNSKPQSNGKLSDISIYSGRITWVDSEYHEELGKVLSPIKCNKVD